MCTTDAELREIRQLLARVQRRFQSMQRQMGQVEELGDTLELEVGVICRLVKQLDSTCAAPVHSTLAKAREEKTLRDLAEHGVESLEIVTRSGGEAEVRVGTGPWFTLTPTLAALLRILAVDNGTPQSEMVGWKTRDHVTTLLGQMFERTFSPGALHMLVWRLRKALEKEGKANPYLVQVSRTRGLRFALRREDVSKGGDG